MPLYDEIEIEDMTYDPETRIYSYPCPCGDRFKISLEDLWDGEDEESWEVDEFDADVDFVASDSFNGDELLFHRKNDTVKKDVPVTVFSL